MDRAQPGVQGSTNRNVEFGETTGQYTDGWIVPADKPTLSSQRYTSLNETAFNEFAATYSTDSLTITIDPGEAFVDGWLARDVATEIVLDGDTTGQPIVIGWDPDAIYDDQQHSVRHEADMVILARQLNDNQTHPTAEIWTFDTDASGITNVEDHRDIGPQLSEKIAGRTAIDYREVVVDNPERLPITVLKNGESIEVPVFANDGEMLAVYRWGAFDASSALDVELLDGNDTIQ